VDGTISPQMAPTLVLGAKRAPGEQLRLLPRGHADACVLEVVVPRTSL
jgi:hypothetical protein